MGLWQDVQFALRLLVKDKWFTLVATLALAFGIGVNATVFTFVNAVLLRGLPVPDSDRILVIGSYERPRDRNMGVSYLDFKDWSEASKSFSSLGAYSGTTMNLSDEGVRRNVTAACSSPGTGSSCSSSRRLSAATS